MPPSSPPGAPTIRSSKPSPLTSPAEETLKPAWSPAVSPWMMKPSAGRERREVDHLPARAVDRAEARRLAEHHIGLAGIVAAVVAAVRPDDQVGEAVAVDVARRGDAVAGVVARRIALDDEAVGRRESVVRSITCRPPAVDRAEARRLAEHHIGLAGIGAAVVAAGRADDQVGEAVAVDVARRGDAAAGLVARRIALDDEAVGGRERREVDHLPAACRRPCRSPTPCRTPHRPRRHRCRRRRHDGAPTIRSAKPSPFTSPAEETLQPARSPAVSPWMMKPCGGRKRREVEQTRESHRQRPARRAPRRCRTRSGRRCRSRH